MKPVTDYYSILNELEGHFFDPHSEKSGKYLKSCIVDSIRLYIGNTRIHIVNILREWIRRYKDPWTILAVTIVGELKIQELLNELYELRNNIKSYSTDLLLFYKKMVGDVIDRLT